MTAKPTHSTTDKKCQCPGCGTIFKITEKQLATPHKKVRCGNCFTIFVAPSYFVKTHPVIPKIKASSNQAKTQEGPANDTPTPNVIRTENRPATDKALKLKRIRPEPTHQAPPSNRTSAGLLFATALSALLLVSQYILHPPHRIIDSPENNIVAQTFCRYANCQAYILRAPQTIEVLSKRLIPHPKAEKSLRLEATIKNKGPFAQPYANLYLQFTDINGRTVASRVFKPEEYLHSDQQPDTFAHQSTAQLQLDLVDPGKSAVGYAITFH